ncbi:MAG TPA: tripartite tricarboxylate transporter substrate binding protein [Burkholderiales bacterium]|nr:tripartite tricarboxylate transporter substrate binding protein [Burkholderiales bacterium]
MNPYTRMLALLLLVSPGTWAQPYPARTVRVIVPYSPGANADLIARIVSQRLAPVWGQQVILDNRPGGATNIGTALAAKSPPDGYTLLLAGPPNAINISLMGKLPYDLMADFAPIVLATRVPNVLAVHPSLPVRTLAELIALARSRPGQLSFASGGLGSANQMAGELLKINAKINIVHVPYKGSAPAITDTIGGHVELLFAGISALIPHIGSGRLRPLATGSTKRLAMIPDVATFIELGHPEMTTSVWFGFMAPAATPRDIVAKLNADMDAALKRKDVRDQLIADGQEPGGGTGEEFEAFLRNEIAKYARVIKLAGIKLE